MFMWFTNSTTWIHSWSVYKVFLIFLPPFHVTLCFLCYLVSFSFSPYYTYLLLLSIAILESSSLPSFLQDIMEKSLLEDAKNGNLSSPSSSAAPVTSGHSRLRYQLFLFSDYFHFILIAVIAIRVSWWLVHGNKWQSQNVIITLIRIT